MKARHSADAPYSPYHAACRGRARKKGAAEVMLTWDWDTQRASIAKALSGIAEVDLTRLWRPATIDETFLQRWMQTVPPNPEP